jgi:uncharacterized protein YndB with AHSA1/START domain
VADVETRTVEQTLRIAAKPETVWRYWTDPERMCEWWGTAAELDPRPGGTCRVDMGQVGAVMRGEFVELIPYERIVFSFGWEAAEGAPPVPPGSTTVEVTLVPDAGDTVLTLRHRGIPVGAADEHAGGWAHFLPLLAQAAAPA